jgi:hypothetical protein
MGSAGNMYIIGLAKLGGSAKNLANLSAVVQEVSTADNILKIEIVEIADRIVLRAGYACSIHS